MKILKITAVGLCLWPAAAFAEVLDLKYGANMVDINNDGVLDLITKIRWDNGNAHSFDSYTIGVQFSRDEEKDVFYAVPLEQDFRKMHFYNGEFASCTPDESPYEINQSTGYRFELNKKGWLQVTKFSRPTDEGYGVEAPVSIATYFLTDVLIENADEPEVKWMPTDARFYLKKVKETVTKKKYCDVQVLMNK